MLDACLLRRLPRQLEFDIPRVGDLNPGDGIDTDKGIAVLGHMIIRAFQQDGIPEPVAQPQVYPHGRIYVR